MRRLILLLALVLIVTACSPPEQWRMWRAGTAKGSTWEAKDLYWTKAGCEAARRALPDLHKKEYATACVPEGLTPKDIGRD